MKLGSDFWPWLRFAIELIKLIIRMFGDDDDKKQAEENNVAI